MIKVRAKKRIIKLTLKFYSFLLMSGFNNLLDLYKKDKPYIHYTIL